MRFLLNERGATILQGLALATVVGFSALVSTRLLQDQKLLQKGAETRDHLEQMHNQIYTMLQNREHCYGTMVQETDAETTGIALDQTRELTNIWAVNNGVGNTPYTVGSNYLEDNITIERIQLITPSATAPTGERLITYPSKLRITYGRLEGNDPNKRTKFGYGGKRITKEIGIMFQLNALSGGAYPVTGCYAVQLSNSTITDGNNNLNQDFCSNLGQNGSLFQWDSTKNKCVLKNNVCPSKTIFAGILSNGNPDCRPLSSYLGYMIDTTGTEPCSGTDANVRLIQDGVTGKIKIDCF
jgi:hypothetical protein